MSALGDLDGALYAADGRMSNDSFDEPLFYFDQHVLCCTGLVLDSIHTIFDAPADIPRGTLFPSGEPEAWYKFTFWVSQLERHYQDRPEPCPYNDVLQAIWAMMHGDVAASWPLREQNLANADEDSTETYVAIPKDPYRSQPDVTPSRHVLSYAGGYERRQACDVVKQGLRGRKPFITEDGYMGLAPAFISESTTKPWHLAILATCSVPLILSEREDCSYRVCGTCFVQGWMEGEVFGELMGAESPRDFWGAILEDTKIRIS